MALFEQNKEYAASLGIALIDNGDTDFYYLGDIEDNPDYVFEWGSCTKIITWVCVMQLVEQGKISLDTDIRTYLPDNFLNRLRYDEPITMLNLMNHNAGFQDQLRDLATNNKAKIQPLGEVLKNSQPPQLRRPGEVVAYSNFSAALAGYIVECVSNQDFGDYVNSNIFAKLGMTHTAIKPDCSDNEWVAKQREKEICYSVTQDGQKTSIGSSLWYINLYPAGSACGTLQDFAKFVTALMPDDSQPCTLFKNPDTLSVLYAPTLYYSDGITPRVAHGMWFIPFGNGLFYHAGGTVGFSTIFAIDPIANKALIALTNIQSEVVFTKKSLPVIFGDYDWGSDEFESTQDISGFYGSMSSQFPHSAVKIFSFLSVLPISKTGDYTYSAGSYTITQVSEKAFLISDGNIVIPFYLGDNGELQMGSDDIYPQSAVGYYAKLTLLILFLLSALFTFLTLFARGFVFVGRKLRKKETLTAPKEKQHLLSLSCMAVAIICVVAFIVSLLLVLQANVHYLPIMFAFGLLATLFGIVSLFFSLLQLNIKGTASKASKVSKASTASVKVLRIATFCASLSITANLLFWELFNFWSI